MARSEDRDVGSLRPIKITKDYIKHAEGSVMVEMGDTRVICTASIEDDVPLFLKGKQQGWITAEYAMLPRSTKERKEREVSKGRVGGRTHEIQRLIGRCLRSVVELSELGERTIWLDCDVVQADGGTRTASITGSFVALVCALDYLNRREVISRIPIKEFLAAVSAGIVEEEVILDLDFEEDSQAEVDMNVVMTESGKIVEVQGTAEKHPFSRTELDKMLEYASRGIAELITVQKEILGSLSGKIGW